MKKWLLLVVALGMLSSPVVAGIMLAPADDQAPSPITDRASRGSELDEEFSDSLYYFTYVDQALHFSTLLGYYAGQRYLAPTAFELQGVRFWASDEDVPDVSCWVYSNDEATDTPDTLISHIWDEAAPTENVDGWVELNLDEDDYVTIPEASEFWVVIGPVPGEDGAGGWSAWLDNDGPVDGARSKTALSNMAPDNMSYTVPYDWMMVALGEFTGDYYDLRAMSLYNDIQKFHFADGEEVEFTARFLNHGTAESPEPSVLFYVMDETMDTVFTCTETIDPIGGESADTVEVTCGDLWTPDETGRYIAGARISADEDELNSTDNIFKLLQCPVASIDTMSYYDDSLEVSIGSTAGTGWGIAFHPAQHPALVETMDWYVQAAQDASELYVWTMDDDGEYEEVWSTTDPLESGWNEFDLSSDDHPIGIMLEEGHVIAGYAIVNDGDTWNLDSTPPVSAANPDMPIAGYRYVGDTLQVSTFGNFPVRAGFGNIPPLPFDLISPANDSILPTAEVELVWHSTLDPEGSDVTYDVYVGWNPGNMGDPLAVDITDTTFTYEGVDGFNRYWQIHAKDGDTDGTLSEMWYFEIDVNHPPTPFSLEEPADATSFPYAEIHEVELDWETSTDSDPEDDLLYTVVMEVPVPDTDSTAVLHVDSLELSGTTVDVPDLMDIDTSPPWDDSLFVTWHVLAISGGDTVASNETWGFVLEPDLSVLEGLFSGVPDEFELAALYPNPFNPTTTIIVALAEATELDVTVYNVMGQKVATLANGRHRAGYQTLTFDATNLASGVYFVQVTVPGELHELRKVTLLR